MYTSFLLPTKTKIQDVNITINCSDGLQSLYKLMLKSFVVELVVEKVNKPSNKYLIKVKVKHTKR